MGAVVGAVKRHDAPLREALHATLTSRAVDAVADVYAGERAGAFATHREQEVAICAALDVLGLDARPRLATLTLDSAEISHGMDGGGSLGPKEAARDRLALAIPSILAEREARLGSAWDLGLAPSAARAVSPGTLRNWTKGARCLRSRSTRGATVGLGQDGGAFRQRPLQRHAPSLQGRRTFSGAWRRTRSSLARA